MIILWQAAGWRQRGVFANVKFAGKSFVGKVGVRQSASRSNRLPGKFPSMISNPPFARIRGRGHRHHFAIVRIYYR
jgi:hypothetical protein